ncbi:MULTISPECIES: glycosyltransferase family 2 protein [Sphingobacterium]|uniref:glycosyltransferase family 2 protein n=1 Tax=Sphingobacterium TaxID=28453 RepID=UPI00257DE9E5|nr:MULTISPECIES: glycosyltransferase family 2 protein [Sphingobacterium]
MEELISVIIPFYNVERYIADTLNSLLQQSIDNFEIILINDNSLDRSNEYAESLLSHQNKINFKIIDNPINMGISYNRNTGISYANGKYIVFVDADDIVSSNFLEKLHVPFVDESVDISVCKYDITTQSPCLNTVNEYANNSLPTGKVTSKQALENLLLDRERSFLWKCMFRKVLFKTINFPKGCNFMEDTVVLPMVYAKAQNIFYLADQTSLYHYQIRPSSATTAKVNVKNFENLSLAITQSVNFIKLNRQDIGSEYLTRFQFICSYNIISNILNSKNVTFEEIQPIYKIFQRNLIQHQFKNLLLQKKLRSIIWLLRLKFYPKSIWKKNK